MNRIIVQQVPKYELNMASAKTLSFEKAIEYMDPMQVTDCLHKTLDFLQRNNNELYFPSISPYVEAFLVNLVSDTRNLRSKSFKYENKNLASDIIEVLEISRDVFRWTHSYENGNLLVYKKIFSNKITKKPAKTSSLAHRLLQAQTQSSTKVHHASPDQANICHHAPESNNQPDLPVASTGFKLQFLYKMLAFINNKTEFTLLNEMPLGQAEYVYSLIKNRARDLGFGYKSMYAPLWEAMEENSVDYEIEVTLTEASSSATKMLILEKVPKNKSKKTKAAKARRKEDKPESTNNTNGLTQKEDVAGTTPTKLNQDSSNQAHEQSLVATSGARSKSLASVKTRDRSISKDRLIQFQKGEKFPATGNEDSTTDVATKANQQECGRSWDGMSDRKAKLLEDLSTPLESDRGIRMMLLMGWNGGALGVRGDGIMEPVMPVLDLPKKAGLGHVPPPRPPKVTPRRPLDFRLTFLRSMYDLLLHGESQKEIQLNEPLAKKEKKFIQSALCCLNSRHTLVLSEEESQVVALVAGELGGRPGLEVRTEYSRDLRTITLVKLTNQPATMPSLSAPRPRAVTSSDVITITEDDADVLITGYEVMSTLPHVDTSGMKVPADKKAVRKRALRLVFLAKLVEALQWDFQSRIVFKFDFFLPKKLKMFMHSIVDSLNQGRWHANLLGWETAVYEDLRALAWDSQLALEALSGSKFLFTRIPLITKDSLPNAGPNPRDNNNDDETDNRNQISNIIDYTKQMHVDTDNSNKENNVVENNVSLRLIEAIVKTTSNLKDAISNIDSNNKDDHFTRKSNDNGLKGTSIHESNNAGAIDNIQHDITDNVNGKDVNLIKIEVDSHIPTEIENTEGVAVYVETECDISEPDVESGGEVKNVTEAKIKVRDISELSDWDRDIQDLEMSILKADLNCVLKEENDTDCDLEMAISETDLNMNIKKEKDIDYLNTKRSHSSSVCSQELDPKKVKICDETDEHVVIIRPKIQNEKITQDLVKQVQTLMANELDKAGGFLPLLKCHGVQNGGLVYSCHDEDDVAWLKKVASDANLDGGPVLHDVCLAKKSRELLIRINSSIPLDARKLFRKFEIYNVGLDTIYWKVLHKHTGSTFIMYIVTVDERSFKYICDEKFSLYCGIDKAQFSIIY